MNIKIKIKKVWCEECGKYITDKTRLFQSEIHLQNRQQNSMQSQRSCITDFGKGVNITMNENTYIKLKINPTENLENRINEFKSIYISIELSS